MIQTFSLTSAQERPIALSIAEAVAASVLALLAVLIVTAYLLDRIGMPFGPATMLLLAGATGISIGTALKGQVKWDFGELLAFVGVVVGVFAWLLWRAWPELLPVSSGPDLTHHLLLINYIEQHWRLVHDPGVEAFLGEMVHYTPGSHTLAALAGAWSHTDGLHAVYVLTAFTVALKSGLIFLITRRQLPDDVPGIAFGLAAVLLLFGAQDYFVGSFLHDSFFAQVISELFAVGMWWALVLWDERPRKMAMLMFALAGSAAFLTWPVWIGPPSVALGGVVLLRSDVSWKQRIAHGLTAAGPVSAIVLLYVAGRATWILMVRTSGAALSPLESRVSWWFVMLSALGLMFAATRRRNRATATLVGGIVLQTAAVFILAKASGADTPYIAMKMLYLAIYPLAVAGSLALATCWKAATSRAVNSRPGSTQTSWPAQVLAWVLVLSLGVAATRTVTAMPRDKPVISESLVEAGRWARDHVAASCVDYLVSSGHTAYWLHLAVLANPRMTSRTGEIDTFSARDAVVRWVVPRSLRYAIAEDFTTLPGEIQRDVNVLARFGRSAVIERRGESWCP